MAPSHFKDFLDQATVSDPNMDRALGPDPLYGLYVSWCLLQNADPRPNAIFRSAMRGCGVDVRGSRLRMTGPAAADYIMASYPSTL